METIKNNKLIFLLVISITLTAGLGYYFKFVANINLGSKVQKAKNIPSVTPVPTPDGFLHPETLNLPSSYMGYVFTKLSPDKNTLGKQALYYDDKSVDLEGTEWVVEKSNVSEKEYQSSVKDFETFTNTKLQKSGWVSEITYNGKKLQAVQGGGGEGSLNGFLKLANKKLQLAITSDHRDTPTCPCNLEFRIFISNVYNLSDLIR